MTNLMFSRQYLENNRKGLKEFGHRIGIAPMPLQTQLKQLAAMMCFDTYQRLPRIKAPTLIMTGDRDYMAVPRNAAILARRIPDAQLVKLEGCGHAFIAEAEQQTFRYMLNFLDPVEAGLSL
jgi:pimeloyl-ACP methyl ester carboxylesterase